MAEFQPKWFLGMNQKEKEAAIEQLRFSPVIKRLLELIDGLEREAQIGESDYDSPSWAYKQADANGALRALSKVKKLLRPKE